MHQLTTNQPKTNQNSRFYRRLNTMWYKNGIWLFMISICKVVQANSYASEIPGKEKRKEMKRKEKFQKSVIWNMLKCCVDKIKKSGSVLFFLWKVKRVQCWVNVWTFFSFFFCTMMSGLNFRLENVVFFGNWKFFEKLSILQRKFGKC